MPTLAIDQGSSSTKAIVVDDAGVVLVRRSTSVRVRASEDGAVEYDPEEILASVLQAGSAATAAAGQPLDAIGLGNQGETVVAWDPRTGEALAPAVSWQDKRARSVTERLAGCGERLKTITGLPLDPYFSGPKMRWLREAGVTGGVITTLDSWLLHRLSGEFVTDAATASRTLLLDLETGDWSDEAFKLLGLDGEDRPRIADCAGELGRTTAFGREVPLTAAIVDQQAALYGLHCRNQGDAKCTYGTGAFVIANAGEQVPGSRKLPASIAWRFSGGTRYCIDGPIHAAGAALSWLERLGLLDSAEALDRAVTRHSPPKAIFVPALAGSGPPISSSEPAGAWLGLSLTTEPQDLVHAAIWGIAAEVARLAKLIEDDLGRPLAQLRVDGGLAASDALLQAQSELLRIPVERSSALDATAAGIAMLAVHGCGGLWPEEEWRPAAVFEPRLSETEAHDWLTRWQSASDAAIDIGRQGAS